MCVGRALVPVM